MEEDLDSILNDLQEILKITGVYLMQYDKKRKPRVNEEEDENAHLLEENVLRYIHYCKDHDFLKNKYLEPNTGVTYDVIIPKEEEEAKPVDDGDGTNVVEKPKSTEPKYKEIKEVVGSEEGSKVKFFREPRLGSYLAVDLTYDTALNRDSLLSAIENLRDYERNLTAQDDRRKEREAQAVQEQVDNTNNNPENQDEPLKTDLAQQEEEKVELQAYKKSQRKLVLGLDTLGLDRMFTFDEKNFIFLTVKTIKSSWENLENSLLIKDRDLKIKMDEEDRILKETFPIEKLDSDEVVYLKEYFAQEKFSDNTLDERSKSIESDFARAKFILDSFINNQTISNNFYCFSKLEFVEFERLFQNIFYFVGINNLDINEENTNKLDWKRARKFWTQEIIKKIAAYNPYGPKSGKLDAYSTRGRIFNNLESINREDLKNYSFVLSRIHELVLILLKVRKEDIIKRRDTNAELIEKRNAAIEEKRLRLEKRENELEEARKQWSDNEENTEPFNEEEFLTKWNETNPDITIPDEVFQDVDEDYEI